MEAYNIDTFKTLDRVRYARSNFIAALHGGSQQHRKRDLGALRRRGLLATPDQQKDSANYRYSPRVYELTAKAKAELERAGHTPTKWIGERQFWHQLMVADILMSFEIACKERGLRFRHRTDILGDAPFQFDASVTHQFAKRTERYDGALKPDALFAINDTHFVLEADRQNEPISRPTLSTSSYLRKILQYREVLKSGSYKALIPNMIVVNVTVSDEHARNIMSFMYEELGMQSKSLLFKGLPVLGTRETYPRPLTHLLDEPFARTGYPPFVISNEV
jgi:hypothetical protein